MPTATLIPEEKMRTSRIWRGAPVVDVTLTFVAIGTGSHEGFWLRAVGIRALATIAAALKSMVLVQELLLFGVQFEVFSKL